MIFTVEIDTDHAAYREFNDDEINWGMIAHDLRRIADKIEGGSDKEVHNMYDINGNKAITFGMRRCK